ncbi:DUF397 domain-containing protein [Actinomadura sp. WMMB 499]|uniref:DUF397 domain-containing protein n=1 Tax=Actinomadura sp. WMMB 499 TaxID=1219491 RepID=UPI001244370D|nr:DUF397 domain-containing protein [Actinomadura sp. WMMB 499]QFG22773.1 DUF397 domain-containing protein [Actinomadura sp. WMMB 499]
MTAISDTTAWFKSSHSGAGNDSCVEVAMLPGIVGVRDSVDPDGPKLAFTPTAWRELTTQIKNGGLA